MSISIHPTDGRTDLMPIQNGILIKLSMRQKRAAESFFYLLSVHFNVKPKSSSGEAGRQKAEAKKRDQITSEPIKAIPTDGRVVVRVTDWLTQWMSKAHTTAFRRRKKPLLQ